MFKKIQVFVLSILIGLSSVSPVLAVPVLDDGQSEKHQTLMESDRFQDKVIVGGVLLFNDFIEMLGVSEAYAEDPTPTFTVDTSQAQTDFKAGAGAYLTFMMIIFGFGYFVYLFSGKKK